MQRLVCVQVSVFQNDKRIQVADDGYLGRLGEDSLLLQVDISPDFPVHGFTVDGNKDLVPKKNMLEEPTAGKRYQLKIPVQKGDRGGYYTTYPANNLRLVEQLADHPDFAVTAAVRIWEIAVISQNGEFFCTTQPTYEAECFLRDGGSYTYPRFDKWPQLDECLVSLLPAGVTPNHISAYQPDEELDRNGLGNNDGVVQWFNFAQGLGALLVKEGTARVHWSQVPRRPRRAYLEKGEKVCFKQLRLPKQTKARGTQFAKEAEALSLV